MSQVRDAAGAAFRNASPHGLRITESNPSMGTERFRPSLKKHGLDVYKSLVAAWKWLEGRRRLQFSSRRLHVTETLSLGEKRNLVLVTVDGAQMLIGTSAAGVQLLTKLEAGSPRATEEGREWGS